MVTKKDVILKVLSELGTGRLTLDDAIKRADTLKPLKTKNVAGTWRYHFKRIGVVTNDETGTYVAPKPEKQSVPVISPVEPVVEAKTPE